MHSLNRLGKIVVNSHDVFLGEIISIDYEKKVALLKVVDWREYQAQPNFSRLKFQDMNVPSDAFTIKYMNDDGQEANE